MQLCHTTICIYLYYLLKSSPLIKSDLAKGSTEKAMTSEPGPYQRQLALIGGDSFKSLLGYGYTSWKSYCDEP